MTSRTYIDAISDLLNTHPDEKEQQRRIREANRILFTECVGGTQVEADLALAEAAAQRESQFSQT